MADATVVTSENSAEFYAAKLGLPASAPTEAVEQTEPVVEKSGEEPTEQKEPAVEAEEQHKPNPKIQKRFDELTKQREDARRDAAKEREAREAAEKRAIDLEAKLNPPKVDSDAKPQPNQFTDAFEYAEALAEWSADHAIKTREKQETEKAQQAEREKIAKAWKAKQESLSAELPDYQEVIADSEVVVSDAVRDAILDSDVGPKILYHLAKNPEVAESLASKTVAASLREIGKLEAKLSEKTDSSAEKPASKISKAPAPITPLKGVSAPVDVPMSSDGKFHGTYAQWKAARKAGKI